jgi:hypothetical protein
MVTEDDIPYHPSGMHTFLSESREASKNPDKAENLFFISAVYQLSDIRSRFEPHVHVKNVADVGLQIAGIDAGGVLSFLTY